jgi:hypothetical protein
LSTILQEFLFLPGNLSSCRASDSPVDGSAPSNWGGIVGIFATRTLACPGATVIPGIALEDTEIKKMKCSQEAFSQDDDCGFSMVTYQVNINSLHTAYIT